MSATVTLGRAAEPDTLGQLFISHGDANYVVRRIGQLAQTIEESESLKDGPIYTDTHRRIAAFNSLQRRTACKSALGNDARG
jgi:hypothetical protein